MTIFSTFKHDGREAHPVYMPNDAAGAFEASYSFPEMADQLAELAGMYEKATTPSAAGRAPLEPLGPLPQPRYQAVFQDSMAPMADGEPTAAGAEGDVAAPATRADGARARLMMAGDLMCRKGQQQAALYDTGRYDFSDSFYLVRDVFSQADLVVGNLETTLAESTRYTLEENRTDGVLNRNAPSTFLDAARWGGFDMLITANNHCLDAGVTGIYQTICHLDQYGFINTGAYLDSADRGRRTPVIVEVNGLRIAFLAYATFYNGRDESLTAEGARQFLGRYSKRQVAEDVARARELGAEFVVCYMHWGVEGTDKVSKMQMQRAREVAQAGVDLIVGSHPHVLQAVGSVSDRRGREVPVAWSLGNFLSSMTGAQEYLETAVLDVTLARRGGRVEVESLSYVPCCTAEEYEGRHYVVVPLTAERVEASAEMRASRDWIAHYLGDDIQESPLVNAEETR